MELKVIDGTPTAISKYIREKEEKTHKLEKKDIKNWPIKEKKLPELQATDMKCVFCDASSKEVEGGYFKKRFICRKCNREMLDIDSCLFDTALKKKLELYK